MTERIRILPEKLCNQIAAGEVIERPASVVKELVENALDAGAEKIVVEIEAGGKRLIRVTDNGCGMTREDAFLCVERHATSKLRSEADLFRLHTLGFRGEALPSIAAISRFRLRTREAEALEGWELQMEGGVLRHAGAVGMPAGTQVEIRNLFFNTPARRKFLRRDETEAGHVTDMLSRLALARPRVQFQLLHNGRPQLDLNPQRRLEERVAGLLGPSILKGLRPVEGKQGELRLFGLISHASLNRSTTANQFTFINGRYIRDRLVQHAVRTGYAHLMPKGRYPVLVLFLEVPAEQVDVNVHPTKHEVRFRNQSDVHDFIVETLKQALRPSTTSLAERTFESRPHTAPDNETVSSPLLLSSADNVATRLEGVVKEPADAFRRPLYPGEEGKKPPQESFSAVKTIFPSPGYYSGLRVIGQFHESYILCQDVDSLILIDQHAAHERIGFEELRAQYRRCAVERQGLLFPMVVDFDHSQAAVLEENVELLEDFGFDLERFGGNSFILKGVPRILAEAEAEALLRDVAAELISFNSSSLMEERVEQLLILMACHRVIRANQQLTAQEVAYLLKELDSVDFNSHCPHGRPVVRQLSLAEIERMFKRS